MTTRLICHSTAYAKDRIFMFQHMPTIVEYSRSGFNVNPVNLVLVSQTQIPFYGILYTRVRVSIWKYTLALANECVPRVVKCSYGDHLCGKYETGFSTSHLL